MEELGGWICLMGQEVSCTGGELGMVGECVQGARVGGVSGVPKGAAINRNPNASIRVSGMFGKALHRIIRNLSRMRMWFVVANFMG